MTLDPSISAGDRRRLSVPAGDGLLRLALKLDAVVTGANGLAYLVLAGPLSDLFGLPVPLLRAVGVFLAVFGGLVWLVGSRERLRPAAVRAVVAVNVVWVVDSVALAGFGPLGLTTAGAVWAVMQAGVVALFAVLQLAGRRRA